MWRRILHNIWWKLGALALAVVLWFAVVGEPEVAATHTVPILYKSLSPDLLIGSNAIDSVRIELRGPSSHLTNVALADVAMTLDLSNVSGPGERTFTLSDADLHLPDEVTFLRSIPSQVRLRFSRLKQKDVPVQIRFGSEIGAGYRVKAQDVTPAVIHIAGPENRIDAITNAQTDALDLRSMTQSGNVRVNTFVADPLVWLESSPLVTVHLEIEKTGK